MPRKELFDNLKKAQTKRNTKAKQLERVKKMSPDSSEFSGVDVKKLEQELSELNYEVKKIETKIKYG